MIALLKSMADETRLEILKALCKKELTVSEIVKIVAKAQPTVSLHLKLLKLNNIITSKRKGKFILYKIKDQNVRKIIEILEQ